MIVNSPRPISESISLKTKVGVLVVVKWLFSGARFDAGRAEYVFVETELCLPAQVVQNSRKYDDEREIFIDGS